jgi:hypothetical protein
MDLVVTVKKIKGHRLDKIKNQNVKCKIKDFTNFDFLFLIFEFPPVSRPL